MKTLILIREQPDKVFYASACGDNCAPWEVMLICKSVAFRRSRAGTGPFVPGAFEVEIRELSEDSQQVFVEMVGI